MRILAGGAGRNGEGKAKGERGARERSVSPGGKAERGPTARQRTLTAAARQAVCWGRRYTAAAIVLALSVLHVAAALAALTGTHWLLAGLLAVGIDCGLVSSEATAILVSSVE